jgi:hypothetical protein
VSFAFIIAYSLFKKCRPGARSASTFTGKKAHFLDLAAVKNASDATNP